MEDSSPTTHFARIWVVRFTTTKLLLLVGRIIRNKASPPAMELCLIPRTGMFWQGRHHDLCPRSNSRSMSRARFSRTATKAAFHSTESVDSDGSAITLRKDMELVRRKNENRTYHNCYNHGACIEPGLLPRGFDLSLLRPSGGDGCDAGNVLYSNSRSRF